MGALPFTYGANTGIFLVLKFAVIVTDLTFFAYTFTFVDIII